MSCLVSFVLIVNNCRNFLLLYVICTWHEDEKELRTHSTRLQPILPASHGADGFASWMLRLKCDPLLFLLELLFLSLTLAIGAIALWTIFRVLHS